jgi:acetylornithine deacetylase/succinyl-diaminopimelate desuccinylase-like protein
MGSTAQDLKEQSLDYLGQFIRIRSRSSASGGEEGELQRVIAAHMLRLGARVRVFEASDIPEFQEHPLCHGPARQYRNRPTVIGELGPQDAPALLILAHSDTVQVFEPDLWTVDPFCGQLRQGSIYGLGASDDKWGLATMLVLMQAVRVSMEPLKKKLIFASTIDEENGVGNGTLLLLLAGVKAEAALYLDGRGMVINIGCLGGSNLYLRPKEPISREDFAYDVNLLADACKVFSSQRASRFERPFFRQNFAKYCSVEVTQRKDDSGPSILIPFYTLPGEDGATFCKQLETVVENALRERTSAYGKSYRQPWFEPALVSAELPLVKHLSASCRAVLGCEPRITTISKQDSFILTNHAGIPTVSFGCTRRVNGPGAPHTADERLEVAELWDGFRIAQSTVFDWLKS